MKTYQLSDPFLKTLSPEQISEVRERLEFWGLNQSSFVEVLDAWFSNFRAADKQLALKLFLNIDYYSHKRFSERLNGLGGQVLRHVHELALTEKDIVLVTPTGQGDSGNRHAYDSHKLWQLPRDQIYEVHELHNQNHSNSVLVVFNDTHGSGNQFLRDVWPRLESLRPSPKRIILLAINIAEEAQEAFRRHIPEVVVFPDQAALSAKQVFTTKEYDRLKQLGERVYSKHPVGYGGTGLLTAYYFQCPNNSLPLIWANGDNNALEGPSGYPWKPLFPYIPKKKTQESSRTRRSASADIGSQINEQSVSVTETSAPSGEGAVRPAIIPPQSIFLHYLDHYFLEMKAVIRFSGYEMRECQRATRLALLAAEEVLVPAAAYFESKLCQRIVDEFQPIFDSGRIFLIGAGANLPEYLQQKLAEYPKDSTHYEAYLKGTKMRRLTPPFKTRRGRATEDIFNKWTELANTDLPYRIISGAKEAPKGFERLWQQVPERLGGKPFIVEYVEPILAERVRAPFLTNALHAIINAAYYESFTKEFRSGLMTDLIYLHSSMDVASFSTNVPYRRLLAELRTRKIDKRIETAPASELLSWKRESLWKEALHDAIATP